MEKNEVLDKIRKLLRLAGNNASPEEAALAAAKAQELILRYKLEMSDVQAEEATREKVGHYSENEPIDTLGRRATWKDQLLYVLADSNACASVTVRFHKSIQMRLVGTKSNVEMVKFLYHFIVPQVEEMTATRVTELCSTDKGYSKIFANNFRLGITDTIWRRLKEMNAAVKQEYAGTTALVRVNAERDLALAKYQQICKAEKFTKGPAPKYRGHNQARAEGQKAGENIRMNRPVGSGGSNKLLS